MDSSAVDGTIYLYELSCTQPNFSLLKLVKKESCHYAKVQLLLHILDNGNDFTRKYYWLWGRNRR